jgi:hypothetical protein
LKCDEPLSNVAFKLNLRRYIWGNAQGNDLKLGFRGAKGIIKLVDLTGGVDGDVATQPAVKIVVNEASPGHRVTTRYPISIG